MYKRVFVFLALALALFVTPSWACFGTIITEGGTPSCTNTFSPGTTTGTFDFSATGDGVLTVKFVTVLTTFTLTATVNHNIFPFDLSEFPANTVAVTYSNGNKDQYDFTGTGGGGLNGLPAKNIDYKGLIELTLSYNISSTYVVHNPAFAHAPGDTTTFTEDILTSYSTSCGAACPVPVLLLLPVGDPTMDGSTPGLSSVAAADEPFTESGDTFCSLTVTPTNNPSGQKSEEEVTLKIVGGSDCTATGIRDKTARLSVWTTDTNGNIVFPPLKNVEGNKFHWDNKNGLNEYDISTDGLMSGQTYTVTVFSSKISPQSKTFVAP
jgi:hypothetical protein